MINVLAWLTGNRKNLFKAILTAAVGVLIGWCVILSNTNKKLSERLEIATNNVEAYQDMLNNSQQANSVLQLNIKELNQQNDSMLHKLDSVRKELGVKPKYIKVAATQTQSVNVNQSKEIEGNIINILKNGIFRDTIRYNDLTEVYCAITKDTLSVGLDLQNTQYIYIYDKKEYKRKKNFVLRILTLDFKKVNKRKYEIINTNDLFNTSDVRIVQSDK